jgi:hypothetical protein
MPPTSAASKPLAALIIDRIFEAGFHGSDLRTMSSFAHLCRIHVAWIVL